jgi:hypothetical protein
MLSRLTEDFGQGNFVVPNFIIENQAEVTEPDKIRAQRPF